MIITNLEKSASFIKIIVPFEIRQTPAGLFKIGYQHLDYHHSRLYPFRRVLSARVR